MKGFLHQMRNNRCQSSKCCSFDFSRFPSVWKLLLPRVSKDVRSVGFLGVMTRGLEIRFPSCSSLTLVSFLCLQVTITASQSSARWRFALSSALLSPPPGFSPTPTRGPKIRFVCVCMCVLPHLPLPFVSVTQNISIEKPIYTFLCSVHNFLCPALKG